MGCLRTGTIEAGPYLSAAYSLYLQGWVCRFRCAGCGAVAEHNVPDFAYAAGRRPVPPGWQLRDDGSSSWPVPRCEACQARAADRIADELLGAAALNPLECVACSDG